MRCREWYGWHFPELSKIITDNLVYAKVVQALGERLVKIISDNLCNMWIKSVIII
jgi:RNA processing factor Prp31